MLYTTNPVIKHKTGLLNLDEELSNVSKACKIMGVSRDKFYRYRELADEGGVDALINRSRRAPISKIVPMTQLNRLLLIMPSHSLHMVSSGPVLSCVNKAFLSQEAASVLSGCVTTLRTSKSG
jgi:hypothetical protein